MQEAVFDHLFQLAKINNMSYEEQLAYRDSQKRLWDNYAIAETQRNKHAAELAKAKEEAITEGMAKGEAKGAEQQKRITILNGLENGFEVAVIALLAGCSEEEVLAVKKEQGL